MGFLDVLLGRSRPVPPNLDVLFAVPAAATTLQASLGLVPTGAGAVCFRRAEGSAGTRAEADALALTGADPATRTEVTTDPYGYTWITCRRTDGDLAALVTGLHSANTAFVDAGLGASLLCTIVGLRDPSAAAPPVGLVYLFKRGTFYPFAPTGPAARDNELELRVRAALAGELPVETDLSRWFPLWEAPMS